MHAIDTTLRPGPHRDLIAQVQRGECRARMFDAERRRMLLEGDWRPLVTTHMAALGYHPEMLEKLVRRVRRNSNVLLRVLRKVALAYRQPPHRTIEGASEQTQRVFREVVLEQGRLSTLPQHWERLVWASNVAITVPVVYPAPGQPYGQRLAYELLGPSNTEVVTLEDSPTAHPIASVTITTPRGGSAWGDQHYLVIDDVAWWTYDARGYLVRRVDHGAGVWPGTVWRRGYGSDWWMREQGAGIVDASLVVAHINARLDLIRQGQDHFRELLIGNVAHLPTQVAGSDAPALVPADPGAMALEIHKAIVSPEDHIHHAIHHAREGAESMGVDADLLDFREGAEGIEPIVAAQKHDELTALREATIEHFRLSEKDSAWKTALILRGSNHPMAIALPPAAVYDGFEARWDELSFVDHPETRLRVLKEQIELGLCSTIDAIQAQHRGISREEATKRARRIAEDEAFYAQLFIEHNIPKDLSERRANIAQLQGRLGGLMSGEQRSENEDARREPERRIDPGPERPERRSPTRSAAASRGTSRPRVRGTR